LQDVSNHTTLTLLSLTVHAFTGTVLDLTITKKISKERFECLEASSKHSTSKSASISVRVRRPAVDLVRKYKLARLSAAERQLNDKNL